MRKLALLVPLLIAGLVLAGVFESGSVTSTTINDPQFRTENGKAIRPRTTDAGILLVSMVLSDGGTTSQVSTTPMTCVSPTHSVTSVGTSATNCPSAQLSARRLILLCNSQENTGNPKVKIRVDGTNPAMGVANVGDVLERGDCFSYPVGSGVTPKCIADTAATAVTALECQ